VAILSYGHEVRRAIPFFACCAALLAAVPAAAQLVPVQRTFGDRSVPRVRAGTLPLRPGGASRVRVIVDLPLPPLAARYGRGLYAAGARHKLDLRSASARAYLQRVETEQNRVAAVLRHDIPQAQIGRRFQVVLDALTVSLPAAKLPALMRAPSVTHVYPSIAYTLALDRSPSIIGADVLRQTRGADGTGIKIAVVDDGIDQTNVFFAPAGFSYPPGFPKGDKGYTTPKVIAAESFPGPNAGAAGRLPLDPKTSFHGTHVAGIAAGDSGTTAPAGESHPQVTGLSGVAPRAWLGNYRVFTVPTPIGHVANTPEIVAAFEAAVKDGMDVINFSGGGPQVEPANDALVEAIHNVAAAGVVPVIAAGNDRDDFGNGSVGSPGTAPDAIAVAAVSNTHVFAPSLDVRTTDAPNTLQGIPIRISSPPDSWSTSDQTLVDVGSIVGTDGKPVERHLCGPQHDLAKPQGTLPRGSLTGVIALAMRGICPFLEKAEQAADAGAVGVILSDNREGEANGIPLGLGMIANLDGDHLRAYMALHGGRTTIRVGQLPLELETGRSGVITSFSSSGPTPFGHDLKPDVSAPGAQVLSATLANTDDSRFAPFDGTSMATPHVAGSAALLLQLHRTWTPAQIKSALVSTAAPAWADTARTREAPVILEGGGLVALPSADDPQLFTEPASLSFENLVVTRGAASRALLVRLADAGDGAGTWQVELQPQATTTGATLDVTGAIAVAPGGEADLAVVARASAAAQQGENYGFVVLRKGAVTRRIPYFFLVDRPALAGQAVLPLVRTQSGDTRVGTDLVQTYRYPAAPFGNAPDTPPMLEDGKEHVYVTAVNEPAANAGVSIIEQPPGTLADPFYLSGPDESTVQGFAGTPVDVNALTNDYLLPVSAAGSSFPRQQRFYVVVDSGREKFTDRSLAGRYVLRSWVNDVTPPSVKLLTTRVSTGRPILFLQTRDAQSGVDPLSITIGLRGALVGAAAFDPVTGIAVVPLSNSSQPLQPGTTSLRLSSSDFQEAKNVDTAGTSIMPNTRTISVRLQVVRGPAVDWLLPAPQACLSGRLEVAASGTRVVRFEVDGKRVAVVRRGSQGIWSATVRTSTLAHGRHVLTAVAVDAHGRSASARRIVRVCRA
jgi:minor extracellular serine protease Vpr